MLVGLASGQVFKIFVDNPFPVPLLTTELSINSLDISAGKKKIALIDANNQLSIYDLKSKELL